RIYLLTAAMNLALPGFSALNWTENGKQQVIALVEGDGPRVAAFRQLVETEKPERAEVQDITIIEYDGDVSRTSEYAMMCSFNQLNKAVPVLLEIRDDMKEMKGDIKEMKGDIKEMKGDIKEMKGDIKEMKGDIKEMKGDIKEIKGDMKVVRRNTDPIPQILEELQPGYAAQFRQVQTDIKAIKERLGMP
ncbi:MAG: hypothetical protein QUS09_01555, partial [Methanotrichaceae archaeon]|nr:hypothetical protein [Methanotrichaceae archaeon]